MKKLFSNKIFLTCFVLELLLIFSHVAGFFKPLNTHNIEYNEFECIDGTEYKDNGVYIDQNLGEQGYFIYGPSFNINKGVYDIVIDYETECLSNKIEVSGHNNNYNSLLYDEFKLNPLVNTQKFTVWTDKDVRGFTVSVLFDGTSSFLVKNITIKETFEGKIYYFIKFLFILTLVDLAVIFIYYCRNKKINKEKFTTGLILFGIVVFASYPLFSSFLTEGDDIVFHLLRIEGLKDGLLSGQFPVRIHPTQFRGYGYANSVFYGEVFLYFPAILRLCGFPLQTSYKIFLFTVNVVTALISYKCFDDIFKNKKIALICAFLYVLAPYRLTNIYVRAAVGEYMAMTFWPVITLGLYRLFTVDVSSKEYKNIWLILMIGYTGIIQTHLLSCEIIAAVSVIVCLILFKKLFRKNTIIELVKFFFATLLINAYYLVPFLDYMVKGGTIISDIGSQQTQAIQGNGIYPAQLFNLFVSGSGMAYGHAVYDYKILGMYNEMGTTVGLSLMISLFIFVYLYAVNNEQIRKEKMYSTCLLMVIAGVLAVFMSTTLFPWDVLCRNLGKIVYNLQFPWRMLSVATIFLTIVTGCVLLFVKNICDKRFYTALICVIISLNIVTSGYMLYNRLNTSKAMHVYDATTFANHGSGSLNEYILTGTQVDRLNEYEPISSDNVNVLDYSKKYINIDMSVSENKGKDGYVKVPLLAYEGYVARDGNGNCLTIEKNYNNEMQILIPADFSDSVSVRFEGFWYWHVAEVISLISIVSIISIVFIKRRSIWK